MPNDVLRPSWFCGEICEDYITHRFALLVTMMGFGPKPLCTPLGPRNSRLSTVGSKLPISKPELSFPAASFLLAPTRIPV